MLFYCEFLNPYKKAELIDAETHEQAARAIKEKYPDALGVSVMTEELHQVEQAEEESQKNYLSGLAERVYNVDRYESQSADQTPETIAEEIRTNPARVISYLLDYIEQIQNQ